MLWTCLSQASHRCVSHRVPRIGVYFMGVPFIDVHPMGVASYGRNSVGVASHRVPLIGVPPIGVSLVLLVRHILPSSLTPLTHPYPPRFTHNLWLLLYFRGWLLRCGVPAIILLRSALSAASPAVFANACSHSKAQRLPLKGSSEGQSYPP
jgi:hypothetical protein